MPTILPTKGPFARGVSQLMYVGDYEVAGINKHALIGGAALAYALLGKGFAARMFAGGIAAWEIMVGMKR